MSAVCVFTPKALVDLDHIWTVGENRWGSDQADTYVRQIAKHADALAARPDPGPPCPDIRAGYRRFGSGSHILFSRETSTGIDVVRILHERMDLGRPN